MLYLNEAIALACDGSGGKIAGDVTPDEWQQVSSTLPYNRAAVFEFNVKRHDDALSTSDKFKRSHKTEYYLAAPMSQERIPSK